MTELLLVRHAHCDHVGRRLVGRLPGIRLSEEGRRQALALAARLRDEPIVAVYSSPLDRALETACTLAAPHRLDVRTHPGITDIEFGDWTGAAFEDLDGDPAWQLFNTRRSAARIPHGEHPAGAQARALGAIDDIARAHPDGRVVVVSHADVIRSILVAVRGMHLDDLLSIDVEPASVTRLPIAGHVA